LHIDKWQHGSTGGKMTSDGGDIFFSGVSEEEVVTFLVQIVPLYGMPSALRRFTPRNGLKGQKMLLK
jgi:hypothetical protein